MKLILTFILVLITSISYAADVRMVWDPTPGADGYKIQISLDKGLTWGEIRDAGNTIPYTWTGAPEDKMLLFRVSAYNGAKEALNDYAGCWYDHRMKMLQPVGLGID